MALQQLRVRQVKAMATEYTDLGNQVERMSTHSVEVYSATGSEVGNKVTLPNMAKYLPGSGNLLVFLNGQKVEAGIAAQYVETDDVTVTFNDPLFAGDLVTFTIVGAGAGFTVAMDHRYQPKTATLAALAEGAGGKLMYRGSPIGDNHTHANQLILDNLAETAGSLTYKGAAIKGGGEWVFKEAPAGALDGINRVFTLTNSPARGSEMVFFDGILQFADPADNGTAENDYWIDYLTGKITFHATKIPASTTVLQITYMKV